MLLITYYTLLMIVALSRGEKDGFQMGGRRNEEPNVEGSLDSPVYDSNVFFKPRKATEKSAYNVPAPILPPSYSAYLPSLGYPAYSYSPYNPYGTAPYSVPSTYGTLLNNPDFMSALMSGSQYAGYGEPYLGSAIYPGSGYGLSNYVSGLSYPPAALRRNLAPTASEPVVYVIPPTIPRSASLASPIGSTFSNTVPGIATPFIESLPYGVPKVLDQGKRKRVKYIPADPQSYING